MAQTFTKIILSGSVDGEPIKVIATATAGTTVHTATSAAGVESCDEVYLWANNISASAVNLGINVGTVTEPTKTILTRVPAGLNGSILVIPGLPYRNSILLHATASTANVIGLTGFVNRISGQSS